MPQKLLGRFSLLKLLGLGTVITICCALTLAIRLISRDLTSNTGAGLPKQNKGLSGNSLESFHHPRHIYPALFERQQQLKAEIKQFNKTLNKLASNNLDHMPGIQQEKLSNRIDLGGNKVVKMNANEKSGQSQMNKEIGASNVNDIGRSDINEEPPCYDVHTFYYPWYGSPEKDGKYVHWNHEYIQHWNREEAKKWRSGTHVPPHDVGSNYYPSLGAYSSSDPDVIEKHMQMLRYARIGVVAVSWYPPGDGDRQEIKPDILMPVILEKAEKYKLKVVVHVEPYKNRNQHTMKANIQYILKQYGSHPALYRTDHGGKKNLPLLYIYDSYLVSNKDWAEIFKREGKFSVRGTDLDGIFIGLLVEQKHKTDILNAGFDGFYTYFATNGFTYGSTWKMWPELSKFAKSNGLLFIPSVGPGYIDTEVRPWNAKNTRKRLGGKYYTESFDNALKCGPKILSITSFNEWHEGTQIESAVQKTVKGRNYLDYGIHGEMFYLNLTRQWVGKFSSEQKM